MACHNALLHSSVCEMESIVFHTEIFHKELKSSILLSLFVSTSNPFSDSITTTTSMNKQSNQVLETCSRLATNLARPSMLIES
jgi:hypothetical protein